MKQSVIRELSAAEVKEKLSQTRQELRSLKLQHAVTPMENPMKIRDARKTVARLATELTKRENQK